MLNTGRTILSAIAQLARLALEEEGEQGQDPPQEHPQEATARAG